MLIISVKYTSRSRKAKSYSTRAISQRNSISAKLWYILIPFRIIQHPQGLEDDSLNKLKEENQTLLAQKLEAEKKLKDVEALVMDALKEKDTHIKDKEAHIESLKEHIATTKNIFKKQMEFCSEELKRLEAENLELKKKSSSFVGEEDLLHQIANLEVFSFM